ncbi:hypothetical protein CSUB01_06333 [Colletotrichum sublineola]|uniref:Uncharacterized protein n=1 Tax=Colletotrichum sublineola TaxID=1173701 RepID=A0A066X338_COLSU|nr:hypothetical protein CSUB01_06333 [Colletotrichum sublineola]
MADQLTSVGVEFSTPEMTRAFYTLERDVKPRKWGLGKISNPDSAFTAIQDYVVNAFWYAKKKYKGENTKIGGRTPGKYKEDNGKDLITSPNEFIHPSARIRYMCREGKGLDDKGDWDCAALTKNGYTLEKIDGPPELGELYPQERIASTYETLSGRVSSVNRSQKPDMQSHDGQKLVVQQVPFEQDLWPLDKAENQWVWTQGTGKDKKTLQEERIGMWERLFIKINDKMVKREEDAAQAASSSDQSKKPGLVRKVYDKVHNTVNDRWQSAKGRVGKMFSRTIAGKMFDRTVGKLLRPAEKPKPSDYPKAHGYYDMISWQRGDPNPKPPPPGKVNQKPAKD